MSPLLLLPALLCEAVAQTEGLTDSRVSWVSSWGASQQIPEPRNTLPAEDLTDATVRQVVHLSLGGAMLRVRLSNAFGTAPLHLSAVHVARPVSAASGAIQPGTDQALLFGGLTEVTIPEGAEMLSDPLAYPVAALADLAITFYEEKAPARETSHPGSRATTYYTHSNVVSAAELPGAKTIEHWYSLAGVDVAASPASFAVVNLGDSITDGHAATTNGNDRWPDVLARRLQADPKTRGVAVVNAGTGGNRLLGDGLGPSALARFDRDVLARAGVRCVLLLEGVNDLGGLHGARQTTEAPSAAAGAGTAHPAPVFLEASAEQHEALVRAVLGSYAQLIARAHAAGLRAIGATMLPFGGSMYARSAANEADRVRINAWVRAPGHFDAVVDFAKVVADPGDASRMAVAFDSGDHLHPSPAGYRAMGEAIPLALFEGRSGRR